ncbi:MAG: PQQ-binding-like beta-propeller repeat protein [Planctomycetes bacterium]|nr:PQQ-binding-like beta-propeller repeat protein [Planctomycetota bacterium]
MRTLTSILAAALSFPAAWGGETWPELRGPTADGQSDATGLPLTWSKTENVAWKTAIHDRGWSSPVIWKDQVWLTTAAADGRKLFTVCVDRETGAIVHDILLFEVAKPENVATINSYASPTPAVESGRVYLHYGTYGTACLDSATGKVLWTRRDLNCDHHMGPGSSPILHAHLLIFQVDGADVQYVVALDKATGKTAWRTDRSVDYERVHPMQRKAFSTPTVIRVADRLQLVSPGSRGVMAYDPLSGEEIWKVRYGGWSMVPRPLHGHGLVFTVTDYDHPELWAIRPDGKGDVTESRVAWKLRQGVPSTPSLLLMGDLLYMVSDNGVASCVEARTGEVVWRERIGGNHASSPLHADGRISCFNQDGAAAVIRPGRQFARLAVNELDGTCMASPAIAGKALFVRTQSHLYRIEERKAREEQ